MTVLPGIFMKTQVFKKTACAKAPDFDAPQAVHAKTQVRQASDLSSAPLRLCAELPVFLQLLAAWATFYRRCAICHGATTLIPCRGRECQVGHSSIEAPVVRGRTWVCPVSSQCYFKTPKMTVLPGIFMKTQVVKKTACSNMGSALRVCGDETSLPPPP